MFNVRVTLLKKLSRISRKKPQRGEILQHWGLSR